MGARAPRGRAWSSPNDGAAGLSGARNTGVRRRRRRDRGRVPRRRRRRAPDWLERLAGHCASVRGRRRRRRRSPPDWDRATGRAGCPRSSTGSSAAATAGCPTSAGRRAQPHRCQHGLPPRGRRSGRRLRATGSGARPRKAGRLRGDRALPAAFGAATRHGGPVRPRRRRAARGAPRADDAALLRRRCYAEGRSKAGWSAAPARPGGLAARAPARRRGVLPSGSPAPCASARRCARRRSWRGLAATSAGYASPDRHGR